MRKWIITRPDGTRSWTPNGWQYSQLIKFLYKIKALKMPGSMLPKGAI